MRESRLVALSLSRLQSRNYCGRESRGGGTDFEVVVAGDAGSPVLDNLHCRN